MALHPSFPKSPHEPLRPEHRWFPADEALRESSYEKLLPPLVAKIREEVFAWRESGYAGVSATSRALLNWWFVEEHMIEGADGTLAPFRYYFAQREAVETVIWLYEVRQAREKFDLLRFDSSGRVSAGMFDESWPRYVLKMATGAGKTKVISLLLAWSYYHKLYEQDSPLSRNFLIIAPNIIVLDRLKTDFDGLRIFNVDPIKPHNGFEGQNWADDFQLTVHLQDDVRAMRDTGNIFLTNIDRVHLREVADPSLDDDDLSNYFLEPFGPKPVGKTTDSKVDLGEIIREVDELVVFNDEAHHIHDPDMAWFKSIQDIHNKMLQNDSRLALQVDVTATPRHSDTGAIFVQTVSDYPLVEAIYQNIVKHPVLPDAASLSRLEVGQSAIFAEKYHDYLVLGIEEWRKTYAELERLGKKSVLFVMVDDTRNCDEVGDYLVKLCPELESSVLVIHTKRNGEISEAASGKSKKELDELRKQAKEIDEWSSPYKAIVSVLVLKEGWDVKNVTTIVGLRAYSAKAMILPEQTLGRGLRPMFRGTDTPETVSVIGTEKFMEFVQSLKSEGVSFEYKRMGGGETPESRVVEVDNENAAKDLDSLEIPIPRLSRRFHREYKDLDALDPAALGNRKLVLKSYSADQLREIVFKKLLDDEIDHVITLDGSGPADASAVVGFFARQLLKDLRLVGGYEVLYPKVKQFMRECLFTASPVNLEDPHVIRNLSEPEVSKTIYDSFKSAINALTVQDKGSTHIEDYIRLRETRPFAPESKSYLVAKKSVFNRIVGQPGAEGLELDFAAFLESAGDVVSFAKLYTAVGFRLDYAKADGDLSTYTPDFIVRTADGTVWIVETKGREELDIPQKMARLRMWCADATAGSAEQGLNVTYRFVYVDEDGFKRHRPTTFAGLAASFTEYQE